MHIYANGDEHRRDHDAFKQINKLLREIAAASPPHIADAAEQIAGDVASVEAEWGHVMAERERIAEESAAWIRKAETAFEQYEAAAAIRRSRFIKQMIAAIIVSLAFGVICFAVFAVLNFRS